MDHGDKKVTLKENLILEALHYDIDVPCPLQRALIWFFSTEQVREQRDKSG